MKLPALLLSDPHFTANPRDGYRWEIFPWLADQCRAEKIASLCILGDLTDAKDYHPASLTNRIAREFHNLLQFTPLTSITVLMGNHDYLRGGHAYFEFLNYQPGVRFVTSPFEDVMDDGPAVLWLPHTKSPASNWKNLDFSHFNYVFIHQTAPGSVASNGQRMEGDELPSFKTTKVYSGDIHVPQVIGDIEYVGSPYPVHFGDHFTPRCILLDSRRRPVDLHFKTISRTKVKVRSVNDIARLSTAPGDQIKIELALDPADAHDWNRIKHAVLNHLKEAQVECLELKVKVAGHEQRRVFGYTPSLSTEEVVTQFVTREDMGGDALDMGLELVR